MYPELVFLAREATRMRVFLLHLEVAVIGISIGHASTHAQTRCCFHRQALVRLGYIVAVDLMPIRIKC
jgi:hypothetical protein